jgi:hypothetical protein
MAGFAPKQIRRFSPETATPDESKREIIRVDLVGIRTDVSSLLSESEILAVALHNAGAIRSVVCVTDRGDVVGTLAGFRGLAHLIGALNEGAQYVAIVEAASSSRGHDRRYVFILRLAMQRQSHRHSYRKPQVGWPSFIAFILCVPGANWLIATSAPIARRTALVWCRFGPESSRLLECFSPVYPSSSGTSFKNTSA